MAIEMTTDRRIAEEVIRLRLGQMLINEMYKKSEFKIPIHLAMGHEAIAVAVSNVMEEEDQVVLPHRNLHYNLARGPSLKAVVDEFLLKKEGIAGAKLGSMNLANEDAGIVYTSSILGNNLSVAAGLALGKKVNGSKGVLIVVTGDGGIEEGAFFESLIFLRTHDLRVIVIVENNEWSLGTQIHERRCDIFLNRFAEALKIAFVKLEGNDPYKYTQTLTQVRDEALGKKHPIIVEVKLQTLGDRFLKTDDYPEGKYVNYHAGPAPAVELSQWPIIREDEGDPLFVLSKHFEVGQLKQIAKDSLSRLKEEIR